jgi:hypothetical protein
MTTTDGAVNRSYEDGGQNTLTIRQAGKKQVEHLEISPWPAEFHAIEGDSNFTFGLRKCDFRSFEWMTNFLLKF